MDDERERTRDSVEQLEEREMRNPITEDASLTEPGEGFEPAAETDPDDPEAEGPPGRITQMPR